MNIHFKNDMSRLSSIAVALLLLIFSQAALGADTRVDLILENGTVLVYKAKEAGYKEGQQLDVVRRGGDVVGTIQIIKVMPAYAQAKILKGADAIRELDIVVVPGTKAAASAPAAVEQAPAVPSAPVKTAPAASASTAETTPATDGGSKSRRSSSSASESSGSESAAAAAPAAAAPASSSGSSRRRGAAAAASAPAETTTEAAPAASSSSSRRGGRGGGSAEPTEAPAGEIPAEGAEGAPKVLGSKPYYVVHAGYFYLKEDLPGVEIERKPGYLTGIDIWKPMKKNANLVTSLMYTRPSAAFFANGRYQRIQFKILEYSLSYILMNNTSTFGGSHTMYGGLGAGYRSASTQTYCDITCQGTTQFEKKTMSGMDYHGIVGLRFQKSLELKFDYCFNRDYYTIDLGYRY